MGLPKMFYYGPWNCPGHFLFSEQGRSVKRSERGTFPWDEWDSEIGIDGKLQPQGDKTEGVALLHHKDGWTALSFWDYSVDVRGGCNSNYFAEGQFTFDEMVEMAKTRFAVRWNRMAFEVKPCEIV